MLLLLLLHSDGMQLLLQLLKLKLMPMKRNLKHHQKSLRRQPVQLSARPENLVTMHLRLRVEEGNDVMWDACVSKNKNGGLLIFALDVGPRNKQNKENPFIYIICAPLLATSPPLS